MRADRTQRETVVAVDAEPSGRRSRSGCAARIAIVVAMAMLAAACGGGGEEESTTGDGAGTAGTTSEPDTPEPTRTAAPSPTPLPAIPQIAIRVTGDEEIVFDYSAGNCDTRARPDLPTRALRIGDELSLTMPHTTNHRLVGTGFDDLTLSCDPVLTSTYDHDPAGQAHHEWLAAVYTEDGSTVHAVVHNEFHGYNAELADSRRALLDGEDPGDWVYLARSGDAEAPMTLTSTGHGGEGLCAVEFWGAHPDVGCDAVSRWTSARDGTLVIDIETTKAGVGGDGVIVDVRVDGAVVWEVDLTDADPSASVRLTEDVAVGSTVDVGVAAGADASFDATELRTVITPDGVRCTTDRWTCTQVVLTAAVSSDGGATYGATSTGPRDLVAAPPGGYVQDAGFSAMWQPSNIVAHPDGSQVMIVQSDERRGFDAQYSCLFRTEDLADPSAWRGWDGADFSLPAVDPYVDDTEAEPCAAVAPAPISGLVWHADLGLFIAVGGFGQFGVNGQYALVSPDLFAWSEPILIQAAEFVFTSDTPPFEPYATLIDHDSPAPSFDVVGSTPHLYFTRINDPVTLDFDLVRVPLEITIEG